MNVHSSDINDIIIAWPSFPGYQLMMSEGEN
jgi:hypothetical protein